MNGMSGTDLMERAFGLSDSIDSGSWGDALGLIHILGERLAGMRDAPASRSAGILPALANEVGKAGTLAAILSHPIGRWARRPTLLDLPLARHLGQLAITVRYVYKAQGDAPG
jgi:hypothetical protein